MIWLISALIATLARTGTHVLNKDLLKNITPIILVTATSLFICLLYSPVFAFSMFQNSVISVYKFAYLGVLVSALFNSFAIIFLMQGLKSGDMSIAVPLRNLVPIFALVWGVFILGESVSFILIPATILVVVGAILLHVKKGFKLALKRKGSLSALAAALMYSFALIADKFALTYIEPIKYVFLVYIGMLICLLSFNVFKKELGKVKNFIKNKWKPIVLISALAAAGTFFTFTAISLVNVTIIAPVLRLEVLFSVIAGGFFFKEKNMWMKILGAALLFAGIILIII